MVQETRLNLLKFDPNQTRTRSYHLQHSESKRSWWQGAILYEIYIRSFKDSNGDGVGDLQGILQELDYLASLNIDAIWITPFYKSPMQDFGYDVSNYCEVDPIFGTMQDFDEVLAKAHGLGLKVIIDQVWSHTSDQHAWFQESAKNKTNSKADWYVWHDPVEGQEYPNNWLSIFGGSAWQWHEGRQQFYLHNFLTSQPDLNWRNPEVVAALMDFADFWLKKGVDGFRLDVCNFYMHDPTFADNPLRTEGMPAQHGISPLNPYSGQLQICSINQKDNIQAVKTIRAKMDQYGDRMIMGEIAAVEDSALASSNYIRGQKRFHTAYNSSLLVNDPLSPKLIGEAIQDLELCLDDGEMTSFAMSTHDFTRACSKWSAQNPQNQLALEKLLIALLPCMKGLTCFYQGEELGLTETDVPEDKIQDPFGKHFAAYFSGRDGCRTPMPWKKNDKHFGFSEGDSTWLPIDPSYQGKSVDALESQSDSLLHFYRNFLAFRRQHEVFRLGKVTNLFYDEQLLGFDRTNSDSTIRVTFNISDSQRIMEQKCEHILLSQGVTENAGKTCLQPYGFLIQNLNHGDRVS